MGGPQAGNILMISDGEYQVEQAAGTHHAYIIANDRSH
jgi:hypothetical protein